MKIPKIEALVVKAIRGLQDEQGSTKSAIANYVKDEYGFKGLEVRKQIRKTLEQGVNFGILQRLKRGLLDGSSSAEGSRSRQSEMADEEGNQVTDCAACRKKARDAKKRKAMKSKSRGRSSTKGRKAGGGVRRHSMKSGGRKAAQRKPKFDKNRRMTRSMTRSMSKGRKKNQDNENTRSNSGTGKDEENSSGGKEKPKQSPGDKINPLVN